MTTYRGQTSTKQYLGSEPPQVEWTMVRGDTIAFRVYVTDDAREPLDIPQWNIQMKIKRPNDPNLSGKITDDATVILTLTPAPDPDDGPGEFTVSLLSTESQILETGDIFDIELSTDGDEIVWTVAQGSIVVLEDVTD